MTSITKEEKAQIAALAFATINRADIRPVVYALGQRLATVATSMTALTSAMGYGVTALESLGGGDYLAILTHQELRGKLTIIGSRDRIIREAFVTMVSCAYDLKYAVVDDMVRFSVGRE